jgi:hypothetical protein
VRRLGILTLLRALVAALAPAALAPEPVAAGDAARRVSFRIRTLLGPEGARAVASDATVDGPPGTDISLDGRAGEFTMAAKLRTDLVDGGRVRIATEITTRRRAGTSARGLPLYEEDVERRTVELAADGSESVVVLPFGRNPGGDELAIDVLPALSAEPAREPAPLSIHIDSVGPGGWLRVEASRVPHRFDVDVELVRDGRRVARGSGRLRLGEPERIPVVAEDGTEAAGVGLTVESYATGCPTDRIDVGFDVDRAGAPVGRGWAGVGSSDSPLVYDLGALSGSLPGAPTELRVRVRPAPEEKP